MTEASSAPENRAVPPKKRKSGVVVPHAPSWTQRLAARVVFILLRAVALTLRYRWNDRPGILANPPAGPVIFCIWHNRLALCMEAYRIYARRRPGKGMAAMVSASRDGGFLSGVLKCFGVQPVRGSSSRRGHQALLELTTWAQRGYDLAITPDGPRGPCYVVQEGVMSLAQLTGSPIVPFSYHASLKFRVKSWDRFQIPLPFARCEMNVAEPITVPRNASDGEREALRRKLEQALRDISPD